MQIYPGQVITTGIRLTIKRLMHMPVKDN